MQKYLREAQTGACFCRQKGTGQRERERERGKREREPMAIRGVRTHYLHCTIYYLSKKKSAEHKNCTCILYASGAFRYMGFCENSLLYNV
jgi:hypothetical protein